MPREEMTNTHAKDISFLQILQDRLDALPDRACMGLPSYVDSPVTLHCKAARPSTWTDVPGLCANRIHCADTFNSHFRGFDSSNAQVVHARLATIVMNDDLAV
jgi:hypothetical protein